MQSCINNIFWFMTPTPIWIIDPMKEKVLVAQSYPTLCDPMDCSLPDAYVHGILQARILEWVAISFSRGTSKPRDWTRVSCITGRFFMVWATWEACWKKVKVLVTQLCPTLDIHLFIHSLDTSNSCEPSTKPEKVNNNLCNALSYFLSYLSLCLYRWLILNKSFIILLSFKKCFLKSHIIHIDTHINDILISLNYFLTL